MTGLRGALKPAPRRASRPPAEPREAPRDVTYENLLSPLRYPGGKRQLITLFEELLANRDVATFVEPFAGGASISLHVARNGLADRVVIGEADPLVYSFWRTAAFDTTWLVDQVKTIEVSVATWERLKANPGRTVRERALACLFLNRTSFSGILHRRAGPIGGKKQKSEYDIGCRFPREELIRRIQEVGKLRRSGKIAAVLRGDYQQTVATSVERFTSKEMLLYFDPPFYAKAQTLYRLSFVDADHRRLADYLMSCALPWVLSYDHHPVIEDLYSTPLIRIPGDDSNDARPSHHLARRTLAYTAHSQRGSGDEYVVTNLRSLPAKEK